MTSSASSDRDRGSEPQQERRDSGFQPAARPPAADTESGLSPLPVDDRIRSANDMLDRETAGSLRHPIEVLFAQRNAAIERLARLELEYHRAKAPAPRGTLANLAQATSADDGACHDLSSPSASPPAPGAVDTAPALERGYQEELTALRAELRSTEERLESALAEVEETRRDAARLQEERDEALSASDMVQLDLKTELDAVQQQVVDGRLQLDHVRRLWEDDQERTHEELETLTERLSAAQQEHAAYRHRRESEIVSLTEQLLGAQKGAAMQAQEQEVAIQRLQDENALLRQALTARENGGPSSSAPATVESGATSEVNTTGGGPAES